VPRFWLLARLALAAGTCIPTQAGINAGLGIRARSPVLAAGVPLLVAGVPMIRIF
jgi:uncharacterized membrane protein YdcZ (DUF606 family)